MDTSVEKENMKTNKICLMIKLRLNIKEPYARECLYASEWNVHAKSVAIQKLAYIPKKQKST